MNSRGSVLIIALTLMMLLTSLVGGFLYAAGLFVLNSGWAETDTKAFWLTEAGLQKGIWYLKTPSGSGGQGEDWPSSGTQTLTESLGGGSYTMVVERWDFALSSNSSTASSNSSAGGAPPSNAIDNNSATYWESGANPSNSDPQDLIITFPYALTINKVQFISPSTGSSARDYAVAVSSDGSSYTTVSSGTNDNSATKLQTFTAQSNVRYLRLRVTEDGTGAPNRVRISTFEAIGSKITSTGTITVSGSNYSRTVSQTVVTDDASPQSQVAYCQPDWAEQ